MDAFAVSVSSGVAIKNMHIKYAIRIGLFFGVFQALMPVFGWSAGRLAAGHIKRFDHWIAFGLLAFIGGKMIYEAFQLNEDSEEKDPHNIYILFTLAIATSIDALAVGVSFSFLDIQIITPVTIIGIITFIFSFAGTYIGNRLGHLFEDKLEIIGGLILIGIGLKILLEHTLFA
jgi:putative Mn2+ efflux pump MntP